MKHYIPHWNEIGISKERYLELLHFCRQYPDWKTEASSLLGIRGMNMDGMPHGAYPGDPVAAAAGRRAKLTEKIRIVEECAAQVDGGKWYIALIQNVCLRRPYASLDATVLPNSNRNSFFLARKDFFLRLNEKKGADGD